MEAFAVGRLEQQARQQQFDLKCNNDFTLIKFHFSKQAPDTIQGTRRPAVHISFDPPSSQSPFLPLSWIITISFGAELGLNKANKPLSLSSSVAPITLDAAKDQSFHDIHSFVWRRPSCLRSGRYAHGPCTTLFNNLAFQNRQH